MNSPSSAAGGSGITSRPHLGDLLSALVDGELARGELEAARRHLRTCSACRQELDATRWARRRLRALPAVEPPSGFLDAVVPGRPPGGAVRAGVGLAAAAAVVAVLGLSTRGENPPVAPPVASLVEVHAASLVEDDPISRLAPAAVATWSTQPAFP